MSEDKKAWFDHIPAHIRYPGMVVALLTFTIVGQIVLISAAFSDGGAQIEENYYERATKWDAERAEQARVERMGWRVELSPPRDGFVHVRFFDKRNRPIPDLRGEAVLKRPHIAGVIAERPLANVPGQDGAYRFAAPEGAPGLWDVEVSVEDDFEHRFAKKIRAEW